MGLGHLEFERINMKKKELVHSDKWYFVAYDTCGNGFSCFDNPSFCFARGKDELISVIRAIKEKYEVNDEEINIFELSDILVSTKQEEVAQKVTIVNFYESPF